MTRLTEQQIEALRWIDSERSYYAGWTENGREAVNGPEAWTHIQIRSDNGSILIARDDFRAINRFIESAIEPDNRMWQLSKSGRSALARANKGGGDA